MRVAISAAVAAAACLAACGGQPSSMNPSPAPDRAELTGAERIHHVLDRLAFGPRPGDAERVASMGVDRWIDEQLDPRTIDDTAAERTLALLETQRKSAAELLADHPDPQEVQQRFPGDTVRLRKSQVVAGQLGAQIQTAAMLRAVASERQLQEVMTQFWENHFSVYQPKAPNRFAMLEYDRDVIRPRALGKFRDLLGAVAKSPMMLYYLDNWQSAVDSLHPNVDEAPIDSRRLASSDSSLRALAVMPRRRGRGLNENYARELMELHTLGVDGGYTQKDVQEVARALSGWTIEAPQLGGGFVFRPEQHDAGEKVVLGHRLAAGRGIADGEEVLDIVARHPSTAHYVTLKLARHFVSDDPPPALVRRCAQTFTTTDGDIRETMRCLVTSREFFSRAAYRAKVKTPFELVASTLRAMNAAPDTTPRSAQLVAQLGQPIYGHLTPDGWPDRGDAWMNTGAILNRVNFAQRVAANQVYGIRLASWPATRELAAAPHRVQVEGVIRDLLGGHASPDTRRILESGERPLLTDASNVRGAAPAPVALNGFPALVGLALGSPEFQHR